MNRYYSRMRPLCPGTFPTSGAQNILNYEDRMYVEEIGCKAWGYVEYNRELSQEEIDAYELIPADLKPFWVVVSSYYNDGRTNANIVDKVLRRSKPEIVIRSTPRKDVYIDYFDSIEEAEQFCESNVKRS